MVGFLGLGQPSPLSIPARFACSFLLIVFCAALARAFYLTLFTIFCKLQRGSN